MTTLWTFSEPTPYFGNESLWYVIQNDTEENVITVLVDATPLSDHLHNAATNVFNAVNSHQALVEALESVVKAFGGAIAADEYWQGEREAIDKARAVLKLAKGEA